MVDTKVNVVLPFGQISERVNGGRIKQLVEIIKKEKIDKIIVGLPLGLKGEENDNTKKVYDFTERFKNDVNIQIEFIDERFTSRQADRMGGQVSRDEKAAMIILQSYLTNFKNF